MARAASSSSGDAAGASVSTKEDAVKTVVFDSVSLPENFCIIEGGGNPNAVRDFADMGQDELMKNIESRKNKVFIMLEEVRRLRVQLQLKTRDAEVGDSGTMK